MVVVTASTHTSNHSNCLRLGYAALSSRELPVPSGEAEAVEGTWELGNLGQGGTHVQKGLQRLSPDKMLMGEI